jgi:predicted RNA binding protein YcfA (HicA-like mRNA interferase family)
VPKLAGVNHREAVRALEKAGFRVAREGKHIVMTDGQRIVTIPRHDPVNAYTMGDCPRCRPRDRGVQEAAVTSIGKSHRRRHERGGQILRPAPRRPANSAPHPTPAASLARRSRRE